MIFDVCGRNYSDRCRKMVDQAEIRRKAINSEESEFRMRIKILNHYTLKFSQVQQN